MIDFNVDNLTYSLISSGILCTILLFAKAVWGRFILKKAMKKPQEETFKYYMFQSVIRALVLFSITLLIIFSGYVNTVHFLVIFIGGYFFVQLYEIKYLISLDKIV